MLWLRTLFLALSALIASAMPASAAERRFSVADFDRIIVEGPYAVRLTIGPPSNAIASGSPQALDGVSVEVQGTTLRVRRNPNAWSSNPGRASDIATVTLATRNLRAASLAGSGRLDILGGRGLRIDIALDGNGRIEAHGLQADNLAVAARGSGTLVVGGSARVLAASAMGSATLDGSRLVADTATIGAATSGAVDVEVRRAVTVTSDGLGSVTIAGRPACTVRGRNAAAVRCGAR